MLMKGGRLLTSYKIIVNKLCNPEECLLLSHKILCGRLTVMTQQEHDYTYATTSSSSACKNIFPISCPSSHGTTSSSSLCKKDYSNFPPKQPCRDQQSHSFYKFTSHDALLPLLSACRRLANFVVVTKFFRKVF